MEQDYNVERVLGSLLARSDEQQRQLGKIEHSLERIVGQHDLIMKRVVAMEVANASSSGGHRMLLLLSGAAATLGGIFATLVNKLW